MDVSELPFPDLYQLLLDGGRLHLDPATDRWFLDGEVLRPGTDYHSVFRRAANQCRPDSHQRP